ncbi:hypothetical protein [Cyanobacterium sp. uoEpiScrs1]|nr:hypothetical protein [Cyanobacterium sp. uoEpiScrs1]
MFINQELVIVMGKDIIEEETCYLTKYGSLIHILVCHKKTLAS